MKWISVKDRLPKQHITVLVYSNTYGVKEDYYAYTIDDVVHFGGTTDEYDDTVTHWMPMIDLPTD